MLERARDKVSVTPLGVHQPRDGDADRCGRGFKPGIAVAIIRECLAGLAALHREEIVHGDIKPSNIMVKRTGNAKIIDIGSAIDLNDMPQTEDLHAAVRRAGNARPRGDHAALRFVQRGLRAGGAVGRRRRCSRAINDYAQLLEAKRTLPQRLHKVLPKEITHSELLMTICRRLTAPDPMLRYASSRAGRHRPRRPGRVSADAGPRRPGQRVRERAARRGWKNWTERSSDPSSGERRAGDVERHSAAGATCVMAFPPLIRFSPAGIDGGPLCAGTLAGSTAATSRCRRIVPDWEAGHECLRC